MISDDGKNKSGRTAGRKNYGRSLLILTVFLVAGGLIAVYTSSSHISRGLTGESDYFLKHQAIRAAAGLVLMLLLSRLDYQRLRTVTKPLLWVSFLLLLFLLFLPESSSLLGGPPAEDGGEKVRRWLSLFGFTFQPSELAKFAVILWGAHTAVNKARLMEDFGKGVLPFMFVMMVIALLIVVEPDLSQSVLICLSLLIMLYLTGARKSHLIPIVLTGAVLFVIFCLLEPYRWERVLGHLGISGTTQGVNYQENQSLIGLGSGGVFGVGWGAGRQKLKFLPEAHKDYILSIIGEEFGFAGAALLVLAYVYFAHLGFAIARDARDSFGFYLSSGLVCMIVVAALINMLVVTGLVPSTGLTLPFISYGGSSLFVCLGSVGVLRNVARLSTMGVMSKDAD
jgi:cell division protein FtsW